MGGQGATCLKKLRHVVNPEHLFRNSFYHCSPKIHVMVLQPVIVFMYDHVISPLDSVGLSTCNRIHDSMLLSCWWLE